MFVKDTNNKGNPGHWVGEDIYNHIHNKELISRIYVHNKMADNPIQKWVRDLNRHFIKEYIQISKNIKMGSISLEIWENQIKTTMRGNWLAQSLEREILDFWVVSLGPMLAVEITLKSLKTQKTKNATMRYHYTPTRMVKIKKMYSGSYWQGCGAIGFLIDGWWECNWKTTFWKFLTLST